MPSIYLKVTVFRFYRLVASFSHSKREEISTHKRDLRGNNSIVYVSSWIAWEIRLQIITTRQVKDRNRVSFWWIANYSSVSLLPRLIVKYR